MAAYTETPLDPLWRYMVDEEPAEARRRVRFNLRHEDDTELTFADVFADLGDGSVKKEGNQMYRPILKKGKYSSMLRKQVDARDDDTPLFSTFARSMEVGRRLPFQFRKNRELRDVPESILSDNCNEGKSRDDSKQANASKQNSTPIVLPRKDGGTTKNDDDSSIWSLLDGSSISQGEYQSKPSPEKRDNLKSQGVTQDDKGSVGSVASSKGTLQERRDSNDAQHPPAHQDGSFFDRISTAIFPSGKTHEDESNVPNTVTEATSTATENPKMAEVIIENARTKRFSLSRRGSQRSVYRKKQGKSQQVDQQLSIDENSAVSEVQRQERNPHGDAMINSRKNVEPVLSTVLTRDDSPLEAFKFAGQASSIDDEDSSENETEIPLHNGSSLLDFAFFNHILAENDEPAPAPPSFLDLWKFFDFDDEKNIEEETTYTNDHTSISDSLTTNCDESMESTDFGEGALEADEKLALGDMMRTNDLSRPSPARKLKTDENSQVVSQPNMNSLKSSTQSQDGIIANNMGFISGPQASTKLSLLGSHRPSRISNQSHVTAPIRQESSEGSLLINREPKSGVPMTSKANGGTTVKSLMGDDELERWSTINDSGKKSIIDQGRFSRAVCCSIKKHFESGDVKSLQYFPDIRMVADEEGSQKPVTAKCAGSVSQDRIGPHVVSSVEFTARRGPQSVYTYEYETGCHMEVRFSQFGERPSDFAKVISYERPPVIRTLPNDVLVKIEASTISNTDCQTRRNGWLQEGQLTLPYTPGVDLVGKVHTIDTRIAKQYKLKKGDRVISLIKYGGNSRFMRMGPEQLLRVPESIDPAEAVCLAETYLLAFQAIHHGQRTGLRYRKDSLAGRSIVVIGALSNVGRAVVELANEANATIVYGTGKAKQNEALCRIGAIPLSRKMEEWIPHQVDTIDMIVDASAGFSGESKSHVKALNNHKWEYIFMGTATKEIKDMISELSPTSKLMCSTKSSTIATRVHIYDVYANWENDTESCKRDLCHLINLLEKRVIKPKILDRMPLSKVAKAHEILNTKRLQGHLVCEPWMKSMQRAVYL